MFIASGGYRATPPYLQGDNPMPPYAPVLFQIPSPYNANPWVLQEFQREAALHADLSPAVWGPALLADYKGHETALSPCPCGGQLWYRARTGGHKCPDCTAYSDRHGAIIGIEATKEGSHV